MEQMKRLELTEEELKKVETARKRHEGTKVDQEWYFISKFGMYYGFEGVRAILNNEISLEVANNLMAGAQKVEAQALFNSMQAVFVGTGSVQSKKPSQTFKNLTRDLQKEAKI